LLANKVAHKFESALGRNIAHMPIINTVDLGVSRNHSINADRRTRAWRAVRATMDAIAASIGGYPIADFDYAKIVRAAELLELARTAREKAFRNEIELADVVRLENAAQRALRQLVVTPSKSRSSDLANRVAALTGRVVAKERLP
jgi:hypothetical protein